MNAADEKNRSCHSKTPSKDQSVDYHQHTGKQKKHTHGQEYFKRIKVKYRPDNNLEKIQGILDWMDLGLAFSGQVVDGHIGNSVIVGEHGQSAGHCKRKTVW